MKKILLSTFNETAEKNNFEVFSADEIASYYKEGLMKSMNNQLNKAERDEFVTTIKFLNKAVCIDESGNEVILYFRKSQVQFDTDENGDIMKSMTGTYTDTPENRALNRVGKLYSPTDDFEKSLMDIVKGRYVDNAKNRRLHRVGQEYGRGNGGTDEEGGEKKRGVNRFSTKEKQKIWDSMRTVDDEGAWDSAIEDHFGTEILEKLSEMDEDTAMKKKFQIALRLPQDTIDSCIEEVGTNPEDESTYPGADKTISRNEKRRARHAAKREAAKQAKNDGGDKKGEKSDSSLPHDKWAMDISVQALPEKYRKFTGDSITALKKELGATDIKLSAYIGSYDDTEISIDGKKGGVKFEVTLFENGSGEVSVGSNSSEFMDTEEMVSVMEQMWDDEVWEDDEDYEDDED